MTPAQRKAAYRILALAEKWADESGQDITDDAALLRELASDQVTEPKNGELWHIRRPGALACVTMEIVEVTPKTLLMKPVRDPWAEPERLLRSDMVLIECAKEHQ